jgi:hypothetical protein
MSERSEKNDLTQFESDLAKLVPRTAELDRDQLLFAAAQAAAEAELRPRRGPWRWLWPCSTAAMTMWAVTMTGLWQNQRLWNLQLAKASAEANAKIVAGAPDRLSPTPGNGPYEMRTSRPLVDSPDAPVFTPPAADYLALRQRVLQGDSLELPEHSAPGGNSPIPLPRGQRWQMELLEES